MANGFETVFEANGTPELHSELVVRQHRRMDSTTPPKPLRTEWRVTLNSALIGIGSERADAIKQAMLTLTGATELLKQRE